MNQSTLQSDFAKWCHIYAWKKDPNNKLILGLISDNIINQWDHTSDKPSIDDMLAELSLSDMEAFKAAKAAKNEEKIKKIKKDNQTLTNKQQQKAIILLWEKLGGTYESLIAALDKINN